MKYLKKKWFILCIYNIYFALLLYPFLAYVKTSKTNKDSIMFHIFPFVVLGVLSLGYIYEYYRKKEATIKQNSFTKTFILLLKLYIVLSLLIAPFWMLDFLPFAILLSLIGLGGIFYLTSYCRTEKDML